MAKSQTSSPAPEPYDLERDLGWGQQPDNQDTAPREPSPFSLPPSTSKSHNWLHRTAPPRPEGTERNPFELPSESSSIRVSNQSKLFPGYSSTYQNTGPSATAVNQLNHSLPRQSITTPTLNSQYGQNNQAQKSRNTARLGEQGINTGHKSFQMMRAPSGVYPTGYLRDVTFEDSAFSQRQEFRRALSGQNDGAETFHGSAGEVIQSKPDVQSEPPNHLNNIQPSAVYGQPLTQEEKDADELIMGASPALTGDLNHIGNSPRSPEQDALLAGLLGEYLISSGSPPYISNVDDAEEAHDPLITPKRSKRKANASPKSSSSIRSRRRTPKSTPTPTPKRTPKPPKSPYAGLRMFDMTDEELCRLRPGYRIGPPGVGQHL